MGLPDIANSHILNVRRFQNPSNPVSNNSKVSPVCVVFRNVDAAKTVFMAKSKLAKTGIFVSEYLTRKRKHLLDLARNKLGSKNAWSIVGMILSNRFRISGKYEVRRILSVKDHQLNYCFSHVQFVQCHVLTLCFFQPFSACDTLLFLIFFSFMLFIFFVSAYTLINFCLHLSHVRVPWSLEKLWGK